MAEDELDEAIERITTTAIAMNNKIAFERAEAQLSGIRFLFTILRAPHCVKKLDAPMAQMDFYAKSLWARWRLWKHLRDKRKRWVQGASEAK